MIQSKIANLTFDNCMNIKFILNYLEICSSVQVIIDCTVNPLSCNYSLKKINKSGS